VFETEAAVVVLAEIAGIRSEDLRVTVDGEEVRISGIRRVPERTDVKRLLQMEIAAGPFERRLRIAIPFDREKVSAHLSDGFLTVTLPRRGPQRRQVKLET
jgi:HSP20 family protein